MSHQQQHYYESGGHGTPSAQDEVEAMLNSLVGPQPHTSRSGVYNDYNNSNYFNYNQQQQQYSSNIGPPPQLPPRNESNGYLRNNNKMGEGSNNTLDTSYGYPPPSASSSNNYPSSHPLPPTPLPQRVSSVTAETTSTYPPVDRNNSSYSTSFIDPTYQQNIPMPVPHYQHHQRHASGGSIESAPYPPLQYHQHQRNPSQGTPPGSPPAPQHQQVYPPLGYPDATQEIINNSYRPNFTNQVSDASTLVSTPSTVDTPPPIYPPANVGGFRPNPTAAPLQQQQQQQPSRRQPSALRNNMIMTIERPRYSYLPDSINTDGLGNDGEMPFVPVSPDTDSDEEQYFTEQHHANEYSPATTTPSASVIQEYQQKQSHHQPQPEQQQQQPQTSGTQYIDPSSYYMYPPAKHDYPPAEQQPHVEVMAPVMQTQPPAPSPPPTQSEFPQDVQVVPVDTTAAVPTMEEAPKEVVHEPNYGFVSVLSVAFMRNVKGLENVRELWCASEYNESFTGSEAVTIIRNLLKEQVPDDYCICQPPLFSPTQYSQKSLISNSVNAEDTYFLEEDITEQNVPQGVIPSLTPCYSVGCRPGLGGCYSYSCPNVGKDFVVDNKVQATVSHDAADKTTSSSPAGGWLVSHEAWSSRMDREFLLTLDKKEIGRQEVLNETIYSEEKYLADLRILQEVIVRGIEQSGAIEADRVGAFINTVFNNYQELLQMSEAMFKDMLARYHQYEKECVPTIGDILVQHMQFFEEAYVKYSPQALLAKYLAEAEIKKNPEFEKFTKEIAKHERTNRLPIWHYLLSPVTRMQRYPLLIEALLKKTPPDHPIIYEIIKSVAHKADNTATHIKKRLAILHIRDSITFKQGEYHELQLSDPNRRIYHKGTLKRRSGSLDVADKNDIYAFVFDHMLLMTKLRKTNTGEEYRIWKKPIPLQMLVVQNNATNVKYQMSGTATSYTIPGGQVALILHHLGSRGGAVYPFFCSSLEEKQLWTKAIDDAKASLRKRQGDADVFELRPLDDVNFRNIGSGQSSGTTTRVNCSVPFVSSRNEKKIAIGTDNGVFFKTEGQDNSVRRIIQCESVIQLAIMEKYHILIVLTEKALRAYPVDALDSKSNTRAIDRIEVEIAQHVNFFQIGFCNGRDMLVFKKKKNTTSVFTALEPFCDLRDPKNEKLLTHRPSIFSNRPDYLRWFKKYKDFYIGAEASNIHFLKAKLNIVCERGFEVIDPENLTVGRDIPDSEDPEFYFVTRHQEPLKPLAMYRINDKFLLCYDKFAFYVNNRNGSLVPRADKRKPATVCDWEGTPAHIVYEHPYIIAIDPYFIEIRHVDTGELVQIISGENIRLAYYNGGGERPIIHVCMSHSQKPDTQALFHLVLNNHRNSSGYPRR
ncbi:CNH domain-containing protein [Mucor lusitanicus]